MSIVFNGDAFQMRAPCKNCGHQNGLLKTVNNQDTVRCAQCERHCYNAPKTETGREARTVKTTHEAITTKQRYRILERAHFRCESCGKKDNLHVGHLLSVKEGHAANLTDEQINHDDNLIALCDECNLGMGDRSVPPWLLPALVGLRRVTRPKQ